MKIVISADDIVRQDVLSLFSVQAEAILAGGVVAWDDVENTHEWVCAECDERYASIDDARSCHNSEPDSCPKEILEWWIVTAWLAEQLLKRNEAILDWDGVKIWGRQTSGQRIALDAVIEDIAKGCEA